MLHLSHVTFGEEMASTYWTSLRQFQLADLGPHLQSMIHAHASPEQLADHDDGFPLLCGSLLVMCSEQIQRAGRQQGFIFDAKILESLMTCSSLQRIQTFMQIEPKWLFQKLKEVMFTGKEQQRTNLQLKKFQLAKGDLPALLLLQGEDILNGLLALFGVEIDEGEDQDEDVQDSAWKEKQEEKRKQKAELQVSLRQRVEKWLQKPQALLHLLFAPLHCFTGSLKTIT